MQIIRHKTAADLLTCCDEVLTSQEAENNNLIQLLRLILDGSKFLAPPYWFGSIEIGGDPIGCCVHAMPDGLVATALPNNAAVQLYKALVAEIPAPSRIVGTPGFARVLANQFTNGGGRQAHISSKWQIYRLDEVHAPQQQADGELRLGTDDDRYQVEQWGNAYGDERPSFLDVRDFMLRKLASGELYFWYDNSARTMITTSGRGMNALRISSVFTPQEFRGRGYATTAVAAVCQRLLAQGSDYVVLTAGVGEPVARIYRRIGFNPVGHRHSYHIR